jgi:hypothetical protein
MRTIRLQAAIGECAQVGTSQFYVPFFIEDVTHRQSYSAEVSPQSVGIRFHAQSFLNRQCKSAISLEHLAGHPTLGHGGGMRLLLWYA